MGDIVLSEYQKQYLANRKKIIAQKEKIYYDEATNFAKSVYMGFYLGNGSNGSKQFKRQIDKTFVPEFNNWMGVTFKY
jgi:hypothetical protein